jgi:predicted DNA-binding transcriptional regulator AlpA
MDAQQARISRSFIFPIAVSRPDAAALLDISSSTFDEWVRKGWMPRGVKIGALRRWDTADLFSCWRKLAELQLNREDEDDGENPFDHTIG